MTVSGLVARVLVLTAFASAFVAPWPTIRNGWARLSGDPVTYAMGHGYEEWSQRVLWLGLFATLAVVVGAVNRWLGATVLLVGIHGSLFDLGGPASVLIALVLVGAVCVSRSEVAHPLLVRVLVILALVESGYVVLQWLGVDLLRGSAQVAFMGSNPPSGTLGNRTSTGVLLAMIAPLAPVLALPLIAAAVCLSHSMGAVLALAVGLSWRLRNSWAGVIPLLAGAAGFAWLAMTRGLETLRLRGSAYALGLTDWMTSAPLWGHGLGSWAIREPAKAVNDLSGGVWIPAHSDPLQWAYEMGLPGAALLVGFVVMHRRMFASPVGPALVSLGLLASVEFPFHVVTTALVGALLIGLGLSSPLHTGA